MGRYLLTRLASLLPVLFVVALVSFAILHLTPGDPAQIMLGLEAATPERLAALRSQLGLDRPLPVQFLVWLGNALRGDLGKSFYTGEPVLTAILNRLEPTLTLALLAAALAVLLGVPLGTLAAVRRGTWVDRLVMVLAMLGLSVPSFWLGLSLILLFAVQLGWLPSIGYNSVWQSGPTAIRYLILPALALCFGPTALIARMMRSCMLDVLHQDYIRTARAKGLRERAVLGRHALKNAFIPVLTVIGLSFAALAGGAIIIETVFAIPGVGQLVISSVGRRDYPVIQGVLLMMALLYTLINLLVDLCYVYLDPRITYA